MVFPAHAGMNLKIRNSVLFKKGIPRACGDEPVTLYKKELLPMYSPRMRG